MPERIATALLESIEEARETQGKIHCANCVHCKLVPTPSGEAGSYYLRVRCEAGKWRKRLGQEKVYKYFTVARRSIEACDSYVDMGDCGEFLQDLKRILPDKDEIYSPKNGVAN